MHVRVLAPALGSALPFVTAAAFGADGEGVVTSGDVLRIVGTLALVLGLILALAWLVRRVGPLGGATGSMRVLGAVSVGQRERIVLVAVADRQLLVGVAPGSVRLLERFEEPLVAPPEPEGGEDFAARLRAALARQGRAA
jgi:flagellar protein FliO/FliZ